MNDSTERWLPVPGWEGLYEISDLGCVRSLPRAGKRRNRIYGGKLLKPSVNAYGYLVIGLCRDQAMILHLGAPACSLRIRRSMSGWHGGQARPRRQTR